MNSGPAARTRRPGTLGAEKPALLRMPDKGVLTRTEQDRSYVYTPVTYALGMTARRMRQALESGPDREARLARFADELPALNELLRQPGELPRER
ncbi:BlaI/MecI/CopY family transcriptional regulator [Streptomyces sp. CoH27]|uniref:BlaI/MecI/CopY family transcriptional regulator n=1 Tax=Streptomyces sp. CoH27 TaxID=2875763 RepID=UPI001CD25867|nr:BlaI/MecI/CopY family transcriptional regulator [Streptomyces sp. CoH27]